MDGRDDSGRGGVLAFVTALLIVACVVLAVIGVDQGRLQIPFRAHNVTTSVASVPPPPSPVVAPRPPVDMVAVGARVVPSIVDIVADVGLLGNEGAGTGIIVSSDGEVLTSDHVIKGARHIEVTDVVSGLIYQATPLGYDSSHDIAVLKMADAHGLPVARIGDSSTVGIDDQVVAIGNAGGKGGTPTSVVGRTAGLDATIVAQNEADFSRKFLTGMIEIHAGVAAGQSGGALVDDRGEVIGVIAASSGADHPDPQTEGFAVPIDTAMDVVRRIHSGRSSDTVHVGPTATLGVLISDTLTGAGAKVDDTVSGLPAEGAGLAAGDLIVSVDGRPIDSTATLQAVLSMHRPGDIIRIGWTDAKGAPHAADTTLADGPPN